MKSTKFLIPIAIFCALTILPLAESVCPAGEVASNCANCLPTCDVLVRDPKCVCQPGCACANNFLRAYNGTCVSKFNCDAPCGRAVDKIHNPCGSACDRTCENIFDPKWSCSTCNLAQPSCSCIDGLVKNAGGHCVLVDDCGVLCPINEAFSFCGNNDCQNTCANPNKSKSCTLGCNFGCICSEGYMRDVNGICIESENCGVSCGNDPNAFKGTPTCGVKLKCSNIFDTFPVCTGTEVYPQECICKGGYAELNSLCVSIYECPTCKGPNENFLCRSCDITCDNWDLNTCYEKPCKEACYCSIGYARNASGVCVKTSECPARVSTISKRSIRRRRNSVPENNCPLNEQFTQCSNCRQSCGSLAPEPDCVCQPGCTCTDGFLRSSNGTCVSKYECDGPCEGALDMVFNPCGSACDRTCENIKIADWQCSTCNEKEPSCKCVEGLVRNSGGHCVLADDCNIECPKNEAFSFCGANSCQNTCDEPNKIKTCVPECKYGCVCVDGYIRDSNGVCIPKDKCGVSCGGDVNAYLGSPKCGVSVMCSNLHDEIPTCSETEVYPKECICKSGYAKLDGKCVAIDSCPKCEGVHENFLCRSCDITCNNWDSNTCFEKPCKEGCYCNNGFARNGTGICIPTTECPAKHDVTPRKRSVPKTTKECCKNEVFSKCGNCRRSCLSPTIDPSCVCVPGCMCDLVNGYIRSSNGTCVLKTQCEPPCDGALDSVYDPCGGACERTCENINDKNWKCTACNENNPTCTCSEGLVRNLGGFCVLPDDCSFMCPKNEYFSHCGNNDCQDTCENLNKSKNCVPTCTFGCVCRKGAVRDSNGICIDREQCGVSCEGDPNAFYGSPACGYKPKCSNVNEGVSCTGMTVYPKTCLCKSGYLDLNGKCVTSDKCPKCDGANESYLCRSCDITCKNMEYNECFDKNCKDGCYCNTGYARNSKGVCVRQTECPNKSCLEDPNAYFDSCSEILYNACIKEGKPDCHLFCGTFGECRCKEGFVKKDDKCVSTTPVPEPTPTPKPTSKPCSYGKSKRSNPVCEENEKYISNGPKCYPNDLTCQMYFSGDTPDCDYDDYQSGCICADGFVRNDKGKCVLPDECCEDPNSELVSDPYVGTGGTCDNPEFFDNDDDSMPYGCQCKVGYLKTSEDDSTCIAVEDCPPKKDLSPSKRHVTRCANPSPTSCGENEVYQQCPFNEDTTCEMYFQGKQGQFSMNFANCKPACRCNFGFVRNSEGRCVSTNECCGPNASTVAGPGMCGGTCSHPNTFFCNKDWVAFSCQCNSGYVKISDEEPKCIPQSDCCKYLVK